jgi:hypothetical protein
MGGGIGNNGAEQGRIEYQHGACDSGHAAGHHHEQLAARETCEVRPDEQRRFDHAEKDIGRGRKPDGASDLEGALEQP